MKVAIIGGTGYGAVELIRLLHHHPFAEIETVVSHSSSGQELASIYPHLSERIDLSFEEMDVKKICERVDLVYFATPSGVSADLVPPFLQEGMTCIDLSGDFRLKAPGAYEKWYKHSAPDSLYTEEAVYGLSEIYPKEIKKAKLIANPGCYPTATLLALIPLIQNQWLHPQSIIVDAKSGISGAGRGLSLNTHFSEINENMKAYKLAAHQHTPEIEQILSWENGAELQLTFTPHLVPMTRGILTTIYSNLANSRTEEDIYELFRSFYETHPFVRIRPPGKVPSPKEVYGTNFCDIGFQIDERTGRLILVSVIDNLVKGAAGQAVQNMNVMNGWDEKTGLDQIPIYP